MVRYVEDAGHAGQIARNRRGFKDSLGRRLAARRLWRYARGLAIPYPFGFLVRRPPEEGPALSTVDPKTGLPTGARAPRPAEPDYSAADVLALVLESLDDDKAEEIVQIDLRGRSDVADYMVICSGRSSRQVASIAEKLADRMKERFRYSVKMEGKETGDWVLIDTGDVIVHVFRPEVRDFYQLEKMWLPSSAHRGGV